MSTFEQDDPPDTAYTCAEIDRVSGCKNESSNCGKSGDEWILMQVQWWMKRKGEKCERCRAQYPYGAKQVDR